MNPSYSVISFPFLGLELDPSRYFQIGTFNIYYYAVIIAAGLFLAVLYGLRRGRHFGLTEDDILDGVLWIVPVSVIFARAYYCVFKWEDFAANPISVLYIRNGGLAIYGGVIGAALCTVLHCRIKKIRINRARGNHSRVTVYLVCPSAPLHRAVDPAVIIHKVLRILVHAGVSVFAV